MNIRLVTAISLLALFVAPVYAQDYKLGVVNAIKILEQSPQADAARSAIEKEFAPRDKEMVATQKRLKELEDRLVKDGAIMSETERQKLEREVINMKRDLKRTQDEFREDFNFRRNEEFSKIQKKIVEAIQTVAKENNYDLVLSEGVIYASPKVDISDLVIEYLKKNR
ncbi:MAG TPA: OmpH family outer membrane protein [Gammaproteobacteria bacterium]|nr:OmpH family outer membrane protein [Gammaproteobacteria bacterium]